MIKSSSTNNMKNQPYLPWDKPTMARKDFIIIPLYILVSYIMPLIFFAFSYILLLALNLKNETILEAHITQIFGSILGSVIILIVFMALYPKVSFIKLTFDKLSKVPRYILLIIATYIVIIIATPVYDWLIHFLPKSLQFSVTQNQQSLEQLFESHWMLPFVFIDIVILTPIIEELIFRHILIHELGKKISYGFATVISVIAFSSIHVLNATSPFEIGGYFIIAIGLTLVYLKSDKNLAVSITLHALINFVSFITIVCTS